MGKITKEQIDYLSNKTQEKYKQKIYNNKHIKNLAKKDFRIYKIYRIIKEYMKQPD